MNPAKRDECKQRFLRLIGLPDDELDAALSGRQKYDARTLQPRPFEGISVIHNISHDEANRLGLITEAERIVSGMSHVGLKGKVAFVSIDSFHATTFDLINYGEHGVKLGATYDQVRADVEAAALDFMKSCAPLAKTITVSGLGLFCPGVLKLDLDISEDTLSQFQAFRRAFHRYLCATVDGYSKIRESAWDSKLSGHITLGYVVNFLGDQDIEALLDFIDHFTFTPIDFQLTQGEVTRFNNMDDYAGVAAPTSLRANDVQDLSAEMALIAEAVSALLRDPNRLEELADKVRTRDDHTFALKHTQDIFPEHLEVFERYGGSAFDERTVQDLKHHNEAMEIYVALQGSFRLTWKPSGSAKVDPLRTLRVSAHAASWAVVPAKTCVLVDVEPGSTFLAVAFKTQESNYGNGQKRSGETCPHFSVCPCGKACQDAFENRNQFHAGVRSREEAVDQVHRIRATIVAQARDEMQ